MMQFESGSSIYFWIPLGLLAAQPGAGHRVHRSRAGQRVQAVRDDETAAESLGISMMKYRLIPVALSCVISAVAGAYYTQYYFYVGPTQAFGADRLGRGDRARRDRRHRHHLGSRSIGALVVGPLAELISELLRDPPASLSFLEGLTGLDVVGVRRAADRDRDLHAARASSGPCATGGDDEPAPGRRAHPPLRRPAGRRGRVARRRRR